MITWKISIGLTIIPIINRIKNDFNITIYVKIWFPNNHKSITSYCIQESNGAKLHPHLDIDKNNYIIHKCTSGTHVSNSAFYHDKGERIKTNLYNILEIEYNLFSLFVLN